MFKPNFVLNSVTDITVEFLDKNNIKALLLDVDNTLSVAHANKTLRNGVAQWLSDMREADIPMMELIGYCTVLRSITGGRGDYSYEFARYEQTPSDIQEAEVAARASKVAENNED